MVSVVLMQLIVGLLGALSTFYLASRFPTQRIRISALLTLLFAMVININSGISSTEHDLYLSTFFAATFVGMTSKPMLGILHIVAATVIMTVMWQWGYQYYGHLGGALGASAFAGVVTIYGLTIVWQKLWGGSTNAQQH